MATNAICGDSCSIVIGGSSTFEAHRFTLTANAPDIDVRSFGSGDWGEYLSCFKDATIDAECYVPINSLEPGDAASITMTVGTHTLSAPSTKCTNVTYNVDAKDVVNVTYSFRVSDDITGW